MTLTYKTSNNMKRYTLSYIIITLLTLTGMSTHAQTSWNFNTLSDADATLLADDDSGNWLHDTSSNNRWCYIKALSAQPLMANGSELAWGEGLLFSCNANSSGNLRIDIKNKRGWIGGSGAAITIPNLKKGQVVTFEYKTSSSGTARGITPTNLSGTTGCDASTDQQTARGTVAANGDVVLTPTGAIYFYSLTVSEVPSGATVIPGAGTDLYEDVSANTVARNLYANQMLVQLYNGEVKVYDTATLQAVDVDKAASKVTITPKNGTPDVYYGTVANISFSKAEDTGNDPIITNNGVEITEARGWLESAYVKWTPYQGATSYAVYVKGGQFSDYTKIDNMLVRDYGTYGRADMVGLRAADNYAFKVVPIISDNEDATLASTAEAIEVRNYSRAGFAHKGYSGVGAYNDDGTLKSGARVFYVTKNTAKTIQCDVKTSNSARLRHHTHHLPRHRTA